MVDVPQVRSSLKRYMLSFLGLTILGIVSTLYVADTSIVPEENEPRRLILTYKKFKSLKYHWQQLVLRQKEKLRQKKIRERNQRRERMAAKRKERFRARQERMSIMAARKKIVWCLSYPLGGVDQIMNAVEFATGESMATMYADETYNEHFKLISQNTKPRWLNFEQFPDGPWLSNDALPVPTAERVLVKTHCGGYCTHDGPLRCRKEYEWFEGLETVKTFTDMCTSGKKRGPFTGEKYRKKVVGGAVAVIRDPVELVLSRFRDYAMDGKYEYTTSGLYEYCAWSDRFFDGVSDVNEMQGNFRSKKYFEEGVTPPPCFSEFYRILMWQANAVDVVRRQEGLLFYWEDLTNPKGLDGAVNKIINYMDMLRADEDKDYPFENPDFNGVSFEDDDLVKIKSWMSAAAPVYGREQLQKYYEV